VIGLDGLDWKVARPLMDQGRMPHLKALAERGTAGLLETFQPTFSPVVWTSIATGMRPEQHGILFFSQVGPDGKPLPNGLPYTSNCRKVPAIWNIAGEHGREVLDVGWWVSWPAEAVPHGRIFASYAAQIQGNILWKAGVWTNGLSDLSFPPALQDQMSDLLEAGAPQGPLGAEYDARFGRVDPRWKMEVQWDKLFRVAFHGDRTHVRIMERLLKEKVSALNMIYIGLPDVAGHFFWRYREPQAFHYKVAPEKISRLKDHIDVAYETVDAWVGEILQTLPDPEGTRILVISDHGMHAANLDRPNFPQSGAHEDAPPGVIFAAGPGIAVTGLPAGDPAVLGSVYDVTPTLLEWLDLKNPSDMAGKPLRGLMTPKWREAHPIRTGPSYTRGFRAATPPRVPREDANLEFKQGLEELGYLESSPPKDH